MAHGVKSDHKANVQRSRLLRNEQERNLKKEKMKTEKDILEEHLGLVISRIKNVECDMKNGITGSMIDDKLENLRKEKIEYERRIKEYEQTENKGSS